MANVCNWKGFEREVAKVFGTTRAPVSNNITHSDTFQKKLYIEAKKRRSFWVWSLFQDTKKKAAEENKIPMVCIKAKDGRGFLVIARPYDLPAIVEELNLQETSDDS